MSTELDGKITFYEASEPPLRSGTYDVALQQRVRSDDPKNAFDETFQHKLSFAVQGLRFALPAAAIQSQYPPADAQAAFGHVLPHIIFNVKTLPWQRDAGAGAGRVPWLALLTFDDGDPIPEVRTGTVADLTSPPPDTFAYPGLTLGYGQSTSDPCYYIDVPVALFNAIAPPLDDLRWLAHARSIDAEGVARKADAPDESILTEFAAVVSNRLPRPGSRTACRLVSFEGMAPYLPGPGNRIPADKQFVRLAVLSFWSFGCVDQGQTFRELVVALDRKPGTLQVPYVPPPDADSEVVRNALRMGYTAFEEHTRQGALTVSWYRGPLGSSAPSHAPRVPVRSADALVHYDPANGMFDVSLAAAWQLGRLLALADKDFSATQYEWKHMQTPLRVLAFERELLGHRLNTPLPDTGRPLHMDLLETVLVPLLTGMLTKKEDV